MAGLLDTAGEYRQAAVIINNSNHAPPGWLEVPSMMGTMCEYVRANWDHRDLVHIASFVLWRMNWIHPFMNGNGRTARAVSYLTLCAKYGGLLPAKNTVVQQIVTNRALYYAALGECDTRYKQDNLDWVLEPLVSWMAQLLKEQIKASLAS